MDPSSLDDSFTIYTCGTAKPRYNSMNILFYSYKFLPMLFNLPEMPSFLFSAYKCFLCVVLGVELMTLQLLSGACTTELKPPR